MNKTEEIIKVAIEGDYAIQESYYTRPVLFTKLKHCNDIWSVFELDETTVIEDENGEVITVPVTSSHRTKEMFLDPKFWQAIGKAKGWLNKTITVYDEIEEYNNPEELQEMINPAIEERMLIVYALEFHRINLTQSFDDAINYLYNLIK